MTRTRRYLGGLAVGYASQAVTTLVGLWLTAFLLGKLGQEEYGLWLVATQILAYLLLLDLGIVALLGREVAFRSAKEPGQIANVVENTIGLVLWQTPFVAIVALLIWWLFPTDWEPLRQPIAHVLVAFVVLFPMRVVKATLEGLQDLAFIGTATTAAWLGTTALTVWLIILDFGLYALAYGWIVQQGLTSAVWWWRLAKTNPQAIPHRVTLWPWRENGDQITRSLWISLQQVAHVLVSGSDMLIIGRLLGPAAVVPYFATIKLLQVLGHQPQMLAQTAGPGLSELRGTGDLVVLQRVVRALMLGMLSMTGGIVCLVLVVNRGFVGWWIGDHQYGGSLLTMALALALILRHWNTGLLYAVFAFGKDRHMSVVTLLDGIVTVGATVLFVSNVGILGAALASLLGVIVVSLPANIATLASCLHVSMLGVSKWLWPWAWRFSLTAGAAWFAMDRVFPTTILSLITTSLIVLTVYTALMLPLWLQEPLATYTKPRLRKLGVLVGLRQDAETTTT